MKMLFVATALAVGVTALAPRTSHAVLIDFATTGAAGDLGTSVFIDPGTGFRVDGYYMTTGGAWAAANLYRRNQTNDRGFGVCNPDG